MSESIELKEKDPENSADEKTNGTFKEELKEESRLEDDADTEEKKMLEVANEQPKLHLYKKRWFILLLFVLYAASSAFQWIQYCIIANIIMKYYNVSALMVDWTSLISMIVYPPLLIPGSYIIDKMGLRVCGLIGALGTCLGTCIKVFSVDPSLFWVTFLGQTIVSIAMIFILSLPPKLAAVWFGSNEVSTACSIGVFGTQLGTAIGFVLPPILVRNHDNLEDIASDLSFIYNWVAYYTIAATILVIIFFKSEPKLPPSLSQHALRKTENAFTLKIFTDSYKSLLTNKPFLLLTLTYGMNVGVFAAVSTILNQFVMANFPNGEAFAGRVGLAIVLVGMFGAILFGFILDRTKMYKQTTLLLYTFTAIGMLGFTFALEYKSQIVVYLSSSLLGFFMNAYYPVGFEFAAELTYPEPESTSSGILTSMAQTFGILFTYILDYLLHKFGGFWALLLMTGLLATGAVITLVIPNELKRQRILKQGTDKKESYMEVQVQVR